jgi:hypothetical protein
MWFCTGSTLAPGTTVSGSITLAQPGNAAMPVDAIAPKAAGQQMDMGYPLTHVP